GRLTVNGNASFGASGQGGTVVIGDERKARSERLDDDDGRRSVRQGEGRVSCFRRICRRISPGA
ncbi:MAG: hypothetical protein IJ164_05475, partial [Duodenibacillus sp.]|nr:hypothetical protein [Duodenibacillus sp.]